MKSRLFCTSTSLSLGLVLFSGLTLRLAAQTNTTALSGNIADSSGAFIPGATISITDLDSGTTRSTLTRYKGDYSFEQLAPGHYKVHVKAAGGFSEQEEDVQLLVATPLSLNFKLTVGTSEIVTVDSGSIAAINQVDATLGKAFDSHQVQSLPYLANNVTYLLSLQPGVLALDSGAQTGGLNTDTRTGIVNGARQDQTNVTLDGVDDNDVTNGYAFNGALRSTRESVQEFRVTTTNGNADAGRSSGGQVSLLTRSGTNTIHGSAYEYYRSGIGLQNNWYTKQRQLATGTPNIPLKVLQHTYGASFGAPIKKDKLFFFGAYEAFKQASSISVNETVPSLPGGGGLVSGNVVYAACAPGVSSCTSSSTYLTLNAADIKTIDPKCSANGTCPAGNGTNAAAIAYLKTFPLANSASTGDGYNTGTYNFSSPVPLHQITNIVRLDYILSPKHSVFVRGNLQSDNQATALQFPGQPPAQNIFANNKGIAAGHTWSISNNLANNFRYGLVRQGVANRGSASQPYVSILGINSITATGTNATTQIYVVTTNNFADDITYTRGRHTIQAGVNDRLLFNQRYFDSPLLSNATISSNLLGNGAIAGTGSSLDPGAFACPDCAAVASSFKAAYNNAILANTGVIESSASGTEYRVQNGSLVPSSTVPTHNYHNLEQEYYIQDQWQAIPRLTITAGLRYVYLATPYEVNGQEIAPSTSLNGLVKSRAAAAANGTAYTTPITFRTAGTANGQPNFWTPQKLNFAPRFSFAYSLPDSKTSIRGGFAVAFDHLGQGIIDQYESSSGAVLSLSATNNFGAGIGPFGGGVDNNPRFTGYHNVPLGSVNTQSIPLPATPANNPFSFLNSINDVIKTPYAETFNLTIQHQFRAGLSVTASYVGRLGRHELDNLDAAQPSNLYDPASGQSYFQAIQAFDKLYDAGVSPASVPDSGYFHNIFPNGVYTPKGSSVSYKGAAAFYAALAAGNRGNETNPLFACDSQLPGFQIPLYTCTVPAGQTFRFFYPQSSSVFAQSTVGNSNYNALQLSVRQALRGGVVYDLNYTYGKSLDEGSSPERGTTNGGSGNLLHNAFNPGADYAVSDFDVRHNVTADYTAPLPFGKGKSFLNSQNRIVDTVLGGWQLNGVVHFSTAFPFTAFDSGNYGTNFDLTTMFVQTGPIPTGGHHSVPYTSKALPNYETALKGITPSQALANLRVAYGGEIGQRNTFRADGYFSMDNGFSKSFPTFREQSFILKAEIFNITGSTRFNALTTNAGSTKFGQYTSLLVSPRQMQFSGKYTF